MPYIETISTPQEIEIAVWRLTEELSQLLAMWGDAPLPANFDKASSEKRKREILATALLLRRYWGYDTPLLHADNGAPIIEQGNISISHTTTHVVAAFHPTRRIGVDIETLGTKVARVASRFMSSDELASLPDDTAETSGDISCRLAAMHIAWSVKEAIYKIYPTAVEFREDIILSPISHRLEGSTLATLTLDNKNITAHYTLYNGCSLAWVAE